MMGEIIKPIGEFHPGYWTGDWDELTDDMMPPGYIKKWWRDGAKKVNDGVTNKILITSFDEVGHSSKVVWYDGWWYASYNVLGELFGLTIQQVYKALKYHEDGYITSLSDYHQFIESKEFIEAMKDRYGDLLKPARDARWSRQENRQKASQKMKERLSDPEMRKQLSENSKQNWKNPEYRKRVTEINRANRQSAKARARASEIMKERFKNPEERSKLSEHLKERWERDGYKEKLSQKHKDRLANPEARQAMRERNLKRYEDPEQRKKTADLSRKFTREEAIIIVQMTEFDPDVFGDKKLSRGLWRSIRTNKNTSYKPWIDEWLAEGNSLILFPQSKRWAQNSG